MKVGITYTGRDDKQSNYEKWIRGDDDSIEVVLLAPGASNNLEEINGLVLSGGVDIHPDFFGGSVPYNNMPKSFWKERDEFEFSVLENALQNELPVLGICRGLQLINVFQKGTLIQDLADRNDKHESFLDDGAEHDRTHIVRSEKNSLLKKVAGDEGVVNSAHHQCIDVLGDNLVANSVSPDGVIEGIEWKNKIGRPFMLAVQWHPERMNKTGMQHSPFSEKLRKYFISQVNSTISK